MDVLTLIAAVAASVAAAGACITVWQARGAGRDLHSASMMLRSVADQGQRLVEMQGQAIAEQRSGTQQLEATVSTLGAVLKEATELGELERQALAEQRQAVAEARLHRHLDRLTLVGERVEDLRVSAEATKLERLNGRDTTHALAAAIARLAQAIAATGGDPPLPQCATLAKGNALAYAQGTVDLLGARSEVEAAIATVNDVLRQARSGG